MRGKAAFTLAEVLVTLGIIGVVAALTMPTLISNHQKQVYVTGLKKAISVISQGAQTMLAEEGVDEITHLPGFNKVPDDHPYDISDFEEILTLFNKTFKINKIYNNNESGDYFYETLNMLRSGRNDSCPDACIDSRYRILMSDGTIWAISITSYSGYGAEWNVAVDVNGDKGPNKMGRDIFEFYVNKLGKVYFSDYDDYCTNWIFFSRSGIAAACTAKIVKDGWKMNY